MFKVTKTADWKPIANGQQCAINTSVDGFSATLTTRYEAISYSNIISLGHFPMTVVLIEHYL